METPKTFLYFSNSYILANGNPKKLLIFKEVTFRAQIKKKTHS